MALSVVLLVGIGAAVVDGTMRSREAAQVDRCEHQLRVATGYTERRLGLVANYLEPTLTPSGRVQELHLADLMADACGPGAARGCSVPTASATPSPSALALLAWSSARALPRRTPGRW